MAFDNTDLEAIYNEILRRKTEVGRLSLVEFDNSEYASLLNWAQRIIREHHWWYWRREHIRVIFLAFTMAFVQRYKYTDDSVFWPDFEQVLGLLSMERRFLIMDDLLWPAYQEEGLELTWDGRGRLIVRTLTNEMQQARTWVTQAPRQFIEFFKWYYRHHPDAEVSASLIQDYQKQTNTSFIILDKMLPALTRDCQILSRVIDYAVDNGLYLYTSNLADYRCQITAALGSEYDPGRLRLVRDERSLVRLLQELQNHRTPAQFEQELRTRRGSNVTTPWGDRLSVQTALTRWTPFPYGIYRVDSQEYRIVPQPRLRLETLDSWPLNQVVSWQEGHFLGYKKDVQFQVVIGRRTIEATPYWRSPGRCFYIWLGQAPTGEKLIIDGQLRSESAGAEWHLDLKLRYSPDTQPSLCVSIDRLVLYYPQYAHYPLRVWANNGYTFSDSLREDGVRRFHRHGKLIVPLVDFDTPVDISVTVGDKTVLHQTFSPEPAYLFSILSKERAQTRGQAHVGDQEYILFSRLTSLPKAGPGVKVTPWPEPYCAYSVFQITWEDANQPFELEVGTVYWTFQRRREFIPFFGLKSLSPHLRLKPDQFHRFADVSLRLYSTFDLNFLPLTLEVWSDEDLLKGFDLRTYIQSTTTPNVYEIKSNLWQEVDQLTTNRWGRYILIFQQDGSTLTEISLALIPPVHLDWDADRLYLENSTLQLDVTTLYPAWNPVTRQVETHARLTVRPRTQSELWSEHPGLLRLISEPVLTTLSFPDLGESVQVRVHPCLFGLRLYLRHSELTAARRWLTTYQPVEQADYYHLDRMALYIFSAPEAYAEIRCGARLAWTGYMDANGDLLISDLSFLKEICLDEYSQFSVHSEGLRINFTVRWTPILHEMHLQNEQLSVHYEGPEGTGLRLFLRDIQGVVSQTWELSCQGDKTIETLSLPDTAPGPAYITADYLLSDGQTRPAAHQVQIVKGEVRSPLLDEWLVEGIGFIDEQDIMLLGKLVTS